ncbi:putative F-box protein At5g62660 [Prosopis cineraria]|uniref:putative F-box protein At5g62660 n=1 Tax=Prosopis cineraria TaxID=364024 RepID=UPI00240EDB16|nr:putative F-box protein At5g62660 [Prosopis cineraria]
MFQSKSLSERTLSSVISSPMASKQLVMEDDNPFLPDDIIINILKRLPVKSLIRFQCVSKDWKNLIKTPFFIQDHLHHSNHQNPSLLLQPDRPRNSLRDIHVAVLGCEKRVLDIQEPPLIDSSLDNGLVVVGSCNGLVLARIVERGTSFPLWLKKNGLPPPSVSLLLWNPAIREVKKVPRNINDYDGLYLLVFGFSPIDNDYKIMRITVCELHFVVNSVEVYSLNSGSWKKVGFGNLEGVGFGNLRNVTVNGVMFFVGRKDDFNDQVVSFDLTNEVFTLIPMPDLGCAYIRRLTVYENKIGVIADSVGKDKSHFIRLWVMEEDTCVSGKTWNWTRIHASKHCSLPRELNPMTIWRNEIVFHPLYQIENDVETNKFYLLNIATDEFEKFSISCGYISKIFNYVESLVSVSNIDVEEP